MSNITPQTPEIVQKVKRKPYPSVDQKNVLLRSLEDDTELRRGKFSATFTFRESEARWIKIAEELNRMPGATKHYKEWRKTWQDMKSKVKKKDVEVRRSMSLTGGGPPLPPLSEEEEQVLLTLSETTRKGHTDSQESSVVFDDHTYHMTDCIEEPEITISEQDASTCQATNKSKVHASRKVPAPRQVSTRSSTSSRLQKTLNVAETLTKSLNEKNKIIKEYYDKCILEKKKQTQASIEHAHAATVQAEALAQIARCLTSLTQSNNIQNLNL